MAPDPASAPFAVAGALLAVAGMAKLRAPAPGARALRATRLPGGVFAVRSFGVLESAAGVLALARPDPAVAIAGAGLYLAFAALVGYWLWGPLRPDSCGCLGGYDAPPDVVHLAVNLLAAGTMLAGAVTGVEPLWAVVRDQPAAGSLLTVLAALATYLVAAGLPRLPQLLRSYRGRATHETRIRTLPSFAVQGRGSGGGASS
jgi:hypothetical protein